MLVENIKCWLLSRLFPLLLSSAETDSVCFLPVIPSLRYCVNK